MITAVCARSLKERGSSVWFLDYTACKCNWMQPCAARYAGPPQLYAVPAWLHEWRIWWRGLEAPSADVSWCQLRSFVGRSPQIRIARFMNAKNAEGAMAEYGINRWAQTSSTGHGQGCQLEAFNHLPTGNMWQHLEPENLCILMNIIEHCHSISLPFCFGSESLPLPFTKDSLLGFECCSSSRRAPLAASTGASWWWLGV